MLYQSGKKKLRQDLKKRGKRENKMEVKNRKNKRRTKEEHKKRRWKKGMGGGKKARALNLCPMEQLPGT